jgi:hypothetical protein
MQISMIDEPEFLLPRGKQKDKKKARESSETDEVIGRCNAKHALWFTYYSRGAIGEWIKGCYACDNVARLAGEN